MSTAFKVLVGALIGAAAGVVTGVLIAPTSGKETREKLSDKTDDLLESVKDLLSKHEEEVKKKSTSK